MKAPKTLPRVPDDGEVRRLLAACMDTFEGRLSKRRDVQSEDYLFVDRAGRSLKRDHATHILHRLSVKARLISQGWRSRHAPLRGYAILRQTGDLELVRQVLRHESLAMALRYAHLTKPDVSAKFRRGQREEKCRRQRRIIDNNLTISVF